MNREKERQKARRRRSLIRRACCGLEAVAVISLTRAGLAERDMNLFVRRICGGGALLERTFHDGLFPNLLFR